MISNNIGFEVQVYDGKEISGEAQFCADIATKLAAVRCHSNFQVVDDKLPVLHNKKFGRCLIRCLTLVDEAGSMKKQYMYVLKLPDIKESKDDKTST